MQRPNPEIEANPSLEPPAVTLGPVKKRRMFKMLPQEALTAIAEQLQAENQHLVNELYVRAAPTLANLVTALNTTADAARKGNQAAKQSLVTFFKALDEARDATVTRRPDHFEAPTKPEGWSSTDPDFGKTQPQPQ